MKYDILKLSPHNAEKKLQLTLLIIIFINDGYCTDRYAKEKKDSMGKGTGRDWVM